MIDDAPSKSPAQADRYRVPRPPLQRIAGWCALASTGAILLLIWFVASIPPNEQGWRAFVRWFPVGTLSVVAALGALCVIAIAAAAYWIKIESASSLFPWRRKSGGNVADLHHSRGKWHS